MEIGLRSKPQGFNPAHSDTTQQVDKSAQSVTTTTTTITAKLIDKPCAMKLDMEYALFTPNKSNKPIHLTINQDFFNSMRDTYIAKLQTSLADPHLKNENLKEHVQFIENLQYVFGNDKVELTIYPAYSKVEKTVGNNIGGDTSIEIRLPNGKSYQFVFGAPTYISSNVVDSSTLHCFGETFANNTALAMHIKFLYILTKCSGHEFANNEQTDNLNYNHIIKSLSNGSLPYVELRNSNDNEDKQLNVQGTCNALMLYDGKLIPLSLGVLVDGDGWNDYQILLNVYYANKNWKIASAEDIKEVEKIYDEYKTKQRCYTSPVGGFIGGSILRISGELSKLPIILVSDGITDNMEFFHDKLIPYINNNPTKEDFSKFMKEAQEYMIDLANGQQRIDATTKPDDMSFIYSSNS